MEKYINDTKQYKITSEGKVFSMYRFLKGGKKLKRKIELKPNGVNIAKLIIYINGKQKSVYLKGLMIKYFKLLPPDNYHQYILNNKNGDILDCSLNNLEWKINLKKKSLYYPEAFYNKKRKIIEKICKTCGVRQKIAQFNLQRGQKYTQTYFNHCISCEKKVNKNRQFLYSRTKHGKKYSKEKTKEYVEKMETSYLLRCLRFNRSEVTPQLLNLQKKKLCLSRKLKQQRLQMSSK